MIVSLFLPNHIEKKRPLLISYKGLTSFAVLILSLTLSFNILIFKFDRILGYATNVNSVDLLRYTNDIRSDKGLGELSINDQLSKAAEAKAQDMFKNNYWAHVSPSGKEPWDFIIASGYDYFYAGENLAVDFSDSKSVVRAWYDSPSHRENLLNKNYTDIGFAVVNGELQGRKTTLVVQMFGSPRKAKALANSTSTVKQSPAPEPKQATSEVSKLDNPIAKNEPATIPLDKEAKMKLEEENIPPVESLFEKDIKENTLNKISQGKVLESRDVFSVSKYIAILLGLFLSGLFAVDGFYVRKYGIFRISGHTFFHVALLVLVIAGIWYTNIGLIL